VLDEREGGNRWGSNKRGKSQNVKGKIMKMVVRLRRGRYHPKKTLRRVFPETKTIGKLTEGEHCYARKAVIKNNRGGNTGEGKVRLGSQARWKKQLGKERKPR